MASNLPTGTVTFLFTDIEGSTQIARQLRDSWPTLQDRHHAILRSAIEAHHGYVFQIIGDAFCAAFHQPGEALRAALQAQRDLNAEAWGEIKLRVRMGIHTGVAEVEGGLYRGYLALSSVQRVMSVGHGGQVLLSQSTFDLVEDDLPEDAALRDMGEHRLKDLLRPQHLYQLVVADLPSEFPPLKSLDARPHNLPVQLTSFIGREREMRELAELLTRTRLVTLTGVGGTGKTRLALQVAAEVLDTFKDGAWWIELAPLSDPTLVPQAIATALNVREQTGRPVLEVLKDELHGKDLLLVLDNCEHLIEDCAQVTYTLLQTAPQIRILVTSREPLGLAGEYGFRVRSLSLPAAAAASALAVSQFDAVRLFSDRAVAIQPDFEVSDQNARAVAQICLRLDGIPLAIELAAARVEALGVEQIAARLDDRFRLLTGGSRSALPRHRTLQAAIDWSYQLLSERERVVLRRLSVFAGGWTLEAAESICAGDGLESGEVLDLLARLVSKSLVTVDQQFGGSRYRMLETIREYAGERLFESGETNAVHRKHLDFCVTLAEEGYARQSTEGSAWLERLELEHDNMRAALDWAGLNDREKNLQLAGALAWFWCIRADLSEGTKRVAEALQGNPERNKILGRALVAAGDLAISQGDCDSALQNLEAALALWRDLGERREIAGTLHLLGETRLLRSDFAAALPVLDESLAIGRELGDKTLIGWVLMTTGQGQWGQGNYAAARCSYEEGHSIAVGLTDRRLLENTYHCMADLALFAEDYRTAAAQYGEALKLGRELAETEQMTFDLEGSAMAAAGAGKPGPALRLAGAAITIRQSIGSNATWGWWEAAKERWLGPARCALGDAAAAAVWAEGCAMTLQQAVTYALEQLDE